LGENFLDHRPIQISIDLNSLCDGWLEYPHQQFTLPRINLDSSNEKKMKYLKTLTEKWCGDQKQDSGGRINDTGPQLELQYHKLQEIFVDIPSKAFPSGKKKHKDWKSRAQGIAEGNFRWMTRYLRALKNLRINRFGRVCISYRKDQNIQKVLSDYEKLQISILELKGMTMMDHQLWDLDTFDLKIMEAIQILNKCKSKYDIEVMADRKRQKEFYDKQNRAHHADSKKKRMYNLPHKYAMPPLPGVMKRNDGKEGMVTGHDLDEKWGHQLDLNSSFKGQQFQLKWHPNGWIRYSGPNPVREWLRFKKTLCKTLPI
jgi:hypothetical protein